MDWTVIKTKSGNTFPKDEHDWQWWHPEVPKAFRRLHAEGVRLVIISNQLSVTKKIKPDSAEADQRRAAVRRKVDAIVASLGVPVDYICATIEDVFRKPLTGEWAVGGQ